MLCWSCMFTVWQIIRNVSISKSEYVIQMLHRNGKLHWPWRHVIFFPVWSKYKWKILSIVFRIVWLKDGGLMISYGLIKFMVIKFICLHDFNILVHTIIMAGQTTPPEDQINNIRHVIWGAHIWLKVFQIVSLIPDITKSLQYCSLLEMGTWVISI